MTRNPSPPADSRRRRPRLPVVAVVDTGWAGGDSTLQTPSWPEHLQGTAPPRDMAGQCRTSGDAN